MGITHRIPSHVTSGFYCHCVFNLINFGFFSLTNIFFYFSYFAYGWDIRRMYNIVFWLLAFYNVVDCVWLILSPSSVFGKRQSVRKFWMTLLHHAVVITGA
eukprot:449676_1